MLWLRNELRRAPGPLEPGVPVRDRFMADVAESTVDGVDGVADELQALEAAFAPVPRWPTAGILRPSDRSIDDM